MAETFPTPQEINSRFIKLEERVKELEDTLRQYRIQNYDKFPKPKQGDPPWHRKVDSDPSTGA